MADRSRRPFASNQLAAGAFLAIWSAVGWWAALGTPALWSDEYGADPGPGLLPTLVLTVLSLGALALLLAGARGLSVGEARGAGLAGSVRPALVPAAFVTSLLIYVAVVRPVGFAVASFAFAFPWMLVLSFRHGEGGRPLARMATAAFGAAAGVGLVHFVFLYLIGVPLG